MTRSKSRQIADPASYFSDWCYKIEKHHYETLGVALRNFVKKKISYSSYAIQSPPNYEFVQGYIFYKASNPSHFFQIGAEFDAFRVEVHCGKVADPESPVRGYIVSITDCATWLRTGEIPIANKMVDLASSKAGLLAWRLVEKTSDLTDMSDAAVLTAEHQEREA